MEPKRRLDLNEIVFNFTGGGFKPLEHDKTSISSSHNEDSKDGVKKVKIQQSNFELDKTVDTILPEDKPKCAYCKHRHSDVDHSGCLRCISSVLCSDGKMFVGHNAAVEADLYCARKNGRLKD